MTTTPAAGACPQLRTLAGSGDDLQAALRAVQANEGADGPTLLREEIEAAQAELVDADELLEAGKYKEALRKLSVLEDGLLRDCPALLARMGRCYLGLGELPRALHISASLLRRDGSDVAAQLLRAEAQFQAIDEHIDSEAWDKAVEAPMKLTRQALALDPEHRRAAQLHRKLKAHRELVRKLRQHVVGRQYDRVEELLAGVLGSEVPGGSGVTGCFRARCYAMRARARLELRSYDDCVADCVAAAALDNKLPAAALLRAEALQKLERWDDAASVLEGLYEWKKDNEIYWKVEWAKFEVRRVRRPNYYDILGIDATCTQADVKKAYLRMSVESHPDKVRQKSHRGDLDLDTVETKFKLIGEAYEILSDTAKRELYDRGYDAQGIREVLAVRKRFAGQAPCSQCGEDESGKQGADKKWYCVRCWDSYYRERPDEEPIKAKAAHAANGSPQRSEVSHRSAPSCGPQQSKRPLTATWPPDEPLPDQEAVAKMSVASLKAMLQKMQVGNAGCITRDDLVAAVCEHLERLRLPASSELPSVATSAKACRPEAGRPKKVAASEPHFKAKEKGEAENRPGSAAGHRLQADADHPSGMSALDSRPRLPVPEVFELVD